MTDGSPLPDPLQIALGYARPEQRAVWHALFQLDWHLGMVTAQAREPLLAQVRLAWWRDALMVPAGAAPQGDPVLAAALRHLPGAAAALSGLASCWECLLGEAPLPAARIADYCALRSAAYVAAAQAAGSGGQCDADAALASHWWVLGDTHARLSDAQERASVQALAARLDPAPRLPRALRPLAILAGLGQRAVTLRQPVMDGRGGALLALRLGMFGR